MIIKILKQLQTNQNCFHTFECHYGSQELNLDLELKRLIIELQNMNLELTSKDFYNSTTAKKYLTKMYPHILKKEKEIVDFLLINHGLIDDYKPILTEIFPMLIQQVDNVLTKNNLQTFELKTNENSSIIKSNFTKKQIVIGILITIFLTNVYQTYDQKINAENQIVPKNIEQQR